MDRRQTYSLALVALLGWTSLSFLAGLYVGSNRSWSYLDVATVERRLREVFCEQAIRNGLMKNCHTDFPRYQQ